MKTNCFLSLCLLMASLFASCGGGSDNSEPEPKPQAPSITFAQGTDTAPVIGVDGGTADVSFTATAAWTASVRDGSAWLSVSPQSGSAGDGMVRITAKANDTYDERNAAVVLACGTASKTVTVTQKQKDALTLTSGKVELEADGGTFSIRLKANVSVTCEVEAAAQEWLKTAAGTRALTDKTLDFEALPNEGKEPRQAVITLKGGSLQESVTVYQAGSKPTLVLTEKEYTVGSEGADIKVELKSNTSYEIQMPEVDWIKETDTRAVSSYTHHFTVSPNGTYDSRTAEILFINREEGIEEKVTVNQLQQDAIIVAKSEYEMPSAGGALDFVLQANVELEVSVSADWIVQTDTRTRGLADHKLCFDILPNEDTEKNREGTITVKGKESEVVQTITVKQDKKMSIVIEGDKATMEVSGSAGDMKQAIADAAAQGAKHFVLKGDYAPLQLAYGKNPFAEIAVESLDLSGVAGWPVVADGLSGLPDNAFYGHATLQQIIFPAEVQVIGTSAFYECKELKHVNAPGVLSVGNGAFSYSKKLEEVIMPEVTTLGQTSFFSTGVKKVDFPKLKTLEGSAFWMCGSLVEVNLPEAVKIGNANDGTESKRTGASVFADCGKLEKISLPKAVEIGESAFSYCKQLKEIDLPMTEKIGMSAFKNCSAVTTIRLPKVTEIRGNHAFTNCTALSALYLTAAGSISMGTNCFGDSGQSASKIDLYLNADKKDEVKESFFSGEMVEWKNFDWKSITFVE